MRKDNLIINISEDILNRLRPTPVYVIKIPVLPFLDEPDIDLVIENKIANIVIGKNFGQNIKYQYGFGNRSEFIKKVY